MLVSLGEMRRQVHQVVPFNTSSINFTPQVESTCIGYMRPSQLLLVRVRIKCPTIRTKQFQKIVPVIILCNISQYLLDISFTETTDI